MANKNLSNAKNAKNDEFYTQLNDIQAEVNAYIDYDPDVFRGKTVLLPCDDPEWSNFTRFFAQNFERFGLKKLISTSYAAASKNISAAKNAKGAKKFLIIGNKNVLNTKDIFPLVVSNLLWSGRTEWTGGMWFETKYDDDVERIENGVCMKNVASIWLTNMEHGRRHQPLRLMTMADNIKFSRHKEIRGVGYKKYDNYDATEVSFTDAIPSDYDGVMGVPVTFLDKHCPEQFEIVGITKTWFGATFSSMCLAERRRRGFSTCAYSATRRRSRSMRGRLRTPRSAAFRIARCARSDTRRARSGSGRLARWTQTT